jgi:hypothetical protein|tara:strand:- start:48 stop:239 length:192 start_codon:yes stop_codon:yes gene_type:complete
MRKLKKLIAVRYCFYCGKKFKIKTAKYPYCSIYCGKESIRKLKCLKSNKWFRKNVKDEKTERR